MVGIPVLFLVAISGVPFGCSFYQEFGIQVSFWDWAAESEKRIEEKVARRLELQAPQ